MKVGGKMTEQEYKDCNARLLQACSNVGLISNRILDVRVAMETMLEGLQAECIEPQVLSCLQALIFSMQQLESYAEERTLEILNMIDVKILTK